MEEKEIEIRGVKVRHMDRERERGRWENSRLKISFEGKIFQIYRLGILICCFLRGPIFDTFLQLNKIYSSYSTHIQYAQHVYIINSNLQQGVYVYLKYFIYVHITIQQ